MDLITSLGELALATRLKRLSDRLSADVSRIYSESEMPIRARWFPVLQALSRQAPQSVSGLARRLGLTHTAINQIAAEMELQSLLSSARDRNDERRRLLSLSSDGEAVVRELEPLWDHIREATRELLTDSGCNLLEAIAAAEQQLDQRSMYLRVRDQLRASDLDIGDLEPSQAGRFRDLNLAWLERYFTVEPDDLELLDDPLGRIVSQGGLILAARQGAEVVGVCALIRHQGPVYELAKMAVDEEHQGRGIGRELGRRAIARARELGARTIFLLTSPRLDAAVHLYRSLGFTETSAAPVKHPGYQRCSIIMELEPGVSTTDQLT